MCAKQPTISFLVLLPFPSLIFSLISPSFTVTEVPTLIFVLSLFSWFLFFIIVPTWKLFVDLGGVIGDCASDLRVWCQIVFQVQQEIEANKTLPGCWEPITPLSANHIARSLVTHMQRQLSFNPIYLKSKMALHVYIYSNFISGLKNIILLVKSNFTRYWKV